MAETGTHLCALKQLLWSNMNILVTRQLLVQGHKPIINENRLDTSLVSDIADKLTVVFGDIMDFATLIRTFKEYQVDVYPPIPPELQF